MDTNGKSVAEHNREMEESRVAELQANLARMGLADYLPQFARTKWNFPDKLIACDPQGKAIMCRNGWAHHVAEAMSGILGRAIEAVKLDDAGKAAVYTAESTITIPERHSLATMNRYFDDYRPGFHANGSEIALPHALHALAAPVNFLEEADAYELAAAVKEEYPHYDVDVTATDEGFTVVIHNDDNWLNGFDAERLVAIADVVERFSLTPKRKNAFTIAGDDCDAMPWQIAVAGRHAQQQRIEDGINAILAHLGHPAASIGAHTLSASKPSSASKEKASGKKTSGKEKAKAGA